MYYQQYPKQVTLLCCGPLSNVALAHQLYPDFADNIKEIFIMGGNYQAVGNSDMRTAEFNFYTDTESAHIVIETLKCPIHMMVWESAIEENLDLESVSLMPSNLDRIYKEHRVPILKQSWRIDVLGAVDHPFVHLMNPAEKAIIIPGGFTQWPLTDALMVASFLFPDQMIKSQEKFDCTVELHGWLSRGQVSIDHRESKVPNVNVIQLLNVDAAKNALLWTVQKNWLNFRSDPNHN